MRPWLAIDRDSSGPMGGIHSARRRNCGRRAGSDSRIPAQNCYSWSTSLRNQPLRTQCWIWSCYVRNWPTFPHFATGKPLKSLRNRLAGSRTPVSKIQRSTVPAPDPGPSKSGFVPLTGVRGGTPPPNNVRTRTTRVCGNPARVPPPEKGGSTARPNNG